MMASQPQQVRERCGTGSSSHPSEGTNPAYTSTSDLQPSELGDKKCLLSKQLTLWHFAIVALGN